MGRTFKVRLDLIKYRLYMKKSIANNEKMLLNILYIK